MKNYNLIDKTIIKKCIKNKIQPFSLFNIYRLEKRQEKKWYYMDCKEALKRFDIKLYNLSSDIVNYIIIKDLDTKNQSVKIFDKALEWIEADNLKNKSDKKMFIEKFKNEINDIARDIFEAEIIRIAEILIKYKKQIILYKVNLFNKNSLEALNKNK